MQEQIQVFEYEGQVVEFDLSRKEIMVNATEMAEIFGKKTNDFLRLDQTKSFIQACLSYGNSRNSGTVKNGNARFLAIRKETDLVRVNHRHGTWMHRILALKLAAWLDPFFEVWVYDTIDQLLEGQQPIQVAVVNEEADQIMSRKSKAAQRHKEAEAKLVQSELFVEWLESGNDEKAADQDLKRLAKKVVGQLDLFISRPSRTTESS